MAAATERTTCPAPGPRHGVRGAAASLSGAVLLVVVAGCAAPPPAPPPAPAPSPLATPAPGAVSAPSFAVDPNASELRLLVYRKGPLARFGHNHVITAPLHGTIRAGDSAAASGFVLELRVGELEVDPPAARTEEGTEFAAAVSDAARHGTRENMLGPAVLDAAAHPSVRIVSVALRGPRWGPDVTARVTLRGASRELTFPAAVLSRGDEITVIATFTVRQSDFGIAPFSVLGGGLAVADAVRVRARVIAHRVS